MTDMRGRESDESLDAHDGLVEVVVHGQLEALENEGGDSNAAFAVILACKQK